MDCKIDQKAQEGSGHGTSKPAQDYEFDKKVDDLIKEISNTELVRQDDKKCLPISAKDAEIILLMITITSWWRWEMTSITTLASCAITAERSERCKQFQYSYDSDSLGWWGSFTTERTTNTARFTRR